MPRCDKCGYVYGYHVQSFCPRCHLKEMAGGSDAQGKSKDLLKHGVGHRWQQILTLKNVNQGPFGICGMAAALHVLLLQDPKTASDLAAATFWDIWQHDTVIPGHPCMKEFPTASCGGLHIDLPYLLRQHAQMWHDHPSQLDDSHPDPKNFTDFCVSRALGYLLKATAPGRYDSEKCDFTRFFGDHQTVAERKQFSRGGSLALRTDTVAYVLRDLLGAQVEIAHNNVDVHQTREFWLRDIERKRIKTGQQLIDGISRALNQNKFVIAAVYASLLGNTPQKPSSPALPYDHWVVIKDVLRMPAHPPRLVIWSWGKTDWGRTAANTATPFLERTEDVLMNSIYDLIVGNF